MVAWKPESAIAVRYFIPILHRRLCHFLFPTNKMRFTRHFNVNFFALLLRIISCLSRKKKKPVAKGEKPSHHIMLQTVNVIADFFVVHEHIYKSEKHAGARSSCQNRCRAFFFFLFTVSAGAIKICSESITWWSIFILN